MHLTNKRITPSTWSTDGVVFDVPWQPLPGVVLVCMYPPRSSSEGGILLEGHDAPEGSKYQPDYGVVARVGAGVGVSPGDVVQCRPYDGLQFTHRDYAFIPEGRKLHLYGRVAGDCWDDSVEAIVQL